MIDVILPVLDEADAIPTVLAGLPASFRAIVVDNGSTDDSARVAAAHGAQVVVEPRRGFGSACDAGLRAATADVVCFMDCDGSFVGADLARVVAPITDRRADLVLGCRRPTSKASWPLHGRIGNRVVTALVERRIGVRLHDLGPMRAGRRLGLVALGLTDRRFGWPLEMVLRAAELDWTIQEVPVQYEPRIGRSKVTGTLRGTVRTTADMTRLLR